MNDYDIEFGDPAEVTRREAEKAEERYHAAMPGADLWPAIVEPLVRLLLAFPAALGGRTVREALTEARALRGKLDETLAEAAELRHQLAAFMAPVDVGAEVERLEPEVYASVEARKVRTWLRSHVEREAQLGREMARLRGEVERLTAEGDRLEAMNNRHVDMLIARPAPLTDAAIDLVLSDVAAIAGMRATVEQKRAAVRGALRLHAPAPETRPAPLTEAEAEGLRPAVMHLLAEWDAPGGALDVAVVGRLRRAAAALGWPVAPPASRDDIPSEVRPASPSRANPPVIPDGSETGSAERQAEVIIGHLYGKPVKARLSDMPSWVQQAAAVGDTPPPSGGQTLQPWRPRVGGHVRTAEALTGDFVGPGAAGRRPNAVGLVDSIDDSGEWGWVIHDGGRWPYDTDELLPEPAGRLCVAALVTNAAGQVLLVETQRGHEIPGGGIEEGEEPRAAAIREVAEETGLRLVESDIEYLRTIAGTPKPGATYTSRILVYRVRAEGEPRPGSDAKGAAWWTAQDALHLADFDSLSDLATTHDALLPWAREQAAAGGAR